MVLEGIGVWFLVAVGVLILAAAVIAMLYFRFGFRQRRTRERGKSGILNQSRVEVLDSTAVDSDRRLVLVRCDRIEHLILVGGPADLVVENDVKKVRGPGAPSSRPTGDADQLIAGIAPEPALRPQADDRAVAAAENRPKPAAGGGASAIAAKVAAQPQPADSPRPAEVRRQRQRGADGQPVRREPRPQQARTIQPAPLGAPRPSPVRPQPAAARANGDGAPSGLPNAAVPWTEPDSLENEIVRALRVDPVPRAAERTPAPTAPKPATDPSATLGDLAERLEEALAQEVQTATQERHSERKPDEFAFDGPSAPPAAPSRIAAQPKKAVEPVSHPRPAEPAVQPRSAEQRNRPAKKEPVQAVPEPAEPEAERRRESPAPQPERRDEAPVISLNSRRRETADPLEDEMARLLGELTGDTKGR
jgi:hypothetical protein